MFITTHAVAGALIVAAVSKLTNQEPSTSVLLFGSLVAVMPDIDSVGFVIYELIKKQKLQADEWVYNHRQILHHPLLFLLLGILLFLVLNKVLSVIFIASTLGHFVLDTLVSTQGIQWLYPFNGKRYIIWPIKTPRRRTLSETIRYGGRQKWTEDFSLSLRFSAELLIFIAATTFIIKSLCFT